MLNPAAEYTAANAKPTTVPVTSATPAAKAVATSGRIRTGHRGGLLPFALSSILGLGGAGWAESPERSGVALFGSDTGLSDVVEEEEGSLASAGWAGLSLGGGFSDFEEDGRKTVRERRSVNDARVEQSRNSEHRRRSVQYNVNLQMAADGSTVGM
ncbi:hypothetical protein B9479_006186 [Cryptococcus floricola]|uniref:Uncharacterized protein n=1 Tax=Cryptococcus floricola TaxID=2591691 RepID=A0A5D3ARA4_9TREE|nr:hypothetical protein B9479_006186 [Cryptococcus floricola]